MNTLAAFAPTWLEEILTPDWYERYGQKVEYSKKTRTAADSEAKAIAIGADGFYLLDAIYAETSPASIRNLRAVEVLRQVWLQQYYAPCDSKVQLRTDKDGPPHSSGKIVEVNPKYTSAYAFDGSGLVKRSNKKYSIATFRNGKQYNADLSASYNIAARYWYAILTNSKFTRVWEGGNSSHTLRTPVTLSSLWRLKLCLA